MSARDDDDLTPIFCVCGAKIAIGTPNGACPKCGRKFTGTQKDTSQHRLLQAKSLREDVEVLCEELAKMNYSFAHALEREGRAVAARLHLIEEGRVDDKKLAVGLRTEAFDWQTRAHAWKKGQGNPLPKDGTKK